jgi:hypothetical protein
VVHIERTKLVKETHAWWRWGSVWRSNNSLCCVSSIDAASDASIVDFSIERKVTPPIGSVLQAGQSYSTSTNRRHRGKNTTRRNQQHKNFLLNYPARKRMRFSNKELIPCLLTRGIPSWWPLDWTRALLHSPTDDSLQSRQAHSHSFLHSWVCLVQEMECSQSTCIWRIWGLNSLLLGRESNALKWRVEEVASYVYFSSIRS